MRTALPLRLARVHIGGFRSIRALTLSLSPTTLLVGPNGAGKSNILDAIAFVGDALEEGLVAAVGKRGGLRTLLHRGNAGDQLDELRVELEFRRQRRPESPPLLLAYGLALAITGEGGWRVADEWIGAQGGILARRVDDRVEGAAAQILGIDRLVLRPQQLLLPLIPTQPGATSHEIDPLIDSLAGIRVHAPSLKLLKSPQHHSGADRLNSDASNLASVWAAMRGADPAAGDRVVDLLRQVVPEVVDLSTRTLGSFVLLNATIDGPGGPVELDGSSLSDGTLRAVALLVAAHQPAGGTILLVGEPEAALHPHAAALLFAALESSPYARQLILTTHSPQIVETRGNDLSGIIVVEWRNGQTLAGPLRGDLAVDIEDHLSTGAELLSEGALRAAHSAPAVSLRPPA